MKLYMKATKDEYELPLAVAESAGELAELTGVDKKVIISSISHKRRQWKKVIVEDEDES